MTGSLRVEKIYCTYIMSNISKMLYVGVTNNLGKKVFEHKSKHITGYMQKYNLFKLAYFESFSDIRDAIRHEKQIKGWRRFRKVELIESVNPHWKDLAGDHSRSGEKFKRTPS